MYVVGHMQNFLQKTKTKKTPCLQLLGFDPYLASMVTNTAAWEFLTCSKADHWYQGKINIIKPKAMYDMVHGWQWYWCTWWVSCFFTMHCMFQFMDRYSHSPLPMLHPKSVFTPFPWTVFHFPRDGENFLWVMGLFWNDLYSFYSTYYSFLQHFEVNKQPEQFKPLTILQNSNRFHIFITGNSFIAFWQTFGILL